MRLLRSRRTASIQHACKRACAAICSARALRALTVILDLAASRLEPAPGRQRHVGLSDQRPVTLRATAVAAAAGAGARLAGGIVATARRGKLDILLAVDLQCVIDDLIAGIDDRLVTREARRLWSLRRSLASMTSPIPITDC
jgi:hypothetical protein